MALMLLCGSCRSDCILTRAGVVQTAARVGRMLAATHFFDALHYPGAVRTGACVPSFLLNLSLGSRDRHTLLFVAGGIHPRKAPCRHLCKVRSHSVNDYPAFFDYVDRWMTEDDTRTVTEIKATARTDSVLARRRVLPVHIHRRHVDGLPSRELAVPRVCPLRLWRLAVWTSLQIDPRRFVATGPRVLEILRVPGPHLPYRADEKRTP